MASLHSASVGMISVSVSKERVGRKVGVGGGGWVGWWWWGLRVWSCGWND